MTRFNEISGKIDHSKASGLSASSPMVLAGKSSARVITSSALKFLQYYLESTATSGDIRGMYMRLYLSGAGAGGEAARLFTTINDVACGTAHGAHISLGFASSGELSGLGVAGRNTLHIPDDAGWTGGTLAALQAEIYSDGTASDPDGVTELSFIRVINDGHSNGKADVDTDAFLLSLQGMAAGTGKIVEIGTSMGTVTGTLKIKIAGDTRYLPFYSSAG